MKRIILICLVLSMLLGVASCAKVKAKPTLADTLAIYEDKSLEYDPKLYPYDFTQEEIDGADDESKAKVKDLYDKFCDVYCVDSDTYEKIEKLGVSGVVNKYFLMDYVLRAGLHADQGEFRSRYALINDLIIMDGQDQLNTSFFCMILYNLPGEVITSDAADCIVPVMKEFMPDINDTTYTESKDMARNAMFAQFFYRDALRLILWCGKGEEAAEEWTEEGLDRVAQWGELVKSLSQD